jgi:hypothetical protein
MMEWFVLLIGENSDLEELSKSLNSPELCVIQKHPPEPPGPEFILKSTDFNFIEDTDDVINRADEIISEINGAARLFMGLRKHIWGISLGVSASTPIVSADGTIHDREKIHQVDSIPGCIAIARHDANVNKVLRLYGADDHDWVSLYPRMKLNVSRRQPTVLMQVEMTPVMALGIYHHLKTPCQFMKQSSLSRLSSISGFDQNEANIYKF